MTNYDETKLRVHKAITELTINDANARKGASPTTEFLLNFLLGNVEIITDLIMEDEEKEAEYEAVTEAIKAE
jgi:hypothetical protein